MRRDSVRAPLCSHHESVAALVGFQLTTAMLIQLIGVNRSEHAFGVFLVFPQASVGL